MRKLPKRSWLSLLLTFLLLAGGFAAPAAAQKKGRKPVVVSFGQPNIWSLEQAHYLLARMHAQNLGLQTKDVTKDDLDPNAVNATRINILKSLLEISAAYDQTLGFQNGQIVRNERFNEDRRFELTTKRDDLRANSLQLSRDLSNLQFERAQMVKNKAGQEDLDLEDAKIKQKQEEKAAVDQEISFDDDELKTLGAAPSGTPQAPTPSATPFDKSRLPSSVLDDVVKDDVKKLLDAAHDPRLDASTTLDNHIQMQYEIIAKQLTLLRDEIGPGERLVFLELPQSIYTTPGDGDEKMAQSWWHVNGYTRTDPFVRLLLDLYEVEFRWHQVQKVPAFSNYKVVDTGTACATYNDAVKSRRKAEEAREKAEAARQKNEEASQKEGEACKKEGEACQKAKEALQNAGDALKDAEGVLQKAEDQEKKYNPKQEEMLEAFREFQCQYEMAREKTLRSLYWQGRDSFTRVEQNGARDNSDLVGAVRNLLNLQGDSESRKRERVASARVTATDGGRVSEGGAEYSAHVDAVRKDLLDILSNRDYQMPDPPKYTFKDGIEFVPLGAQSGGDSNGRLPIPLNTVRTVDIIPRQSSLNVNDIQETVKSSAIVALFKAMFGFGAQVNYQRQREQYEQYLHQELYASGFGKGGRDFGWTFGALPGTKRVAPGVRTTYAALVVPDNAESIVLSARGCYFPRKDYQPLDYGDGAAADWGDRGKFGSYNCGDEQTYIIPIPGGGDANSFWVTNVDYQQVTKTDKNEGQRAVVHISGNNFSSQIGVLVDGVPLSPSVGLAQPLLSADDRCKGAAGVVCGDFERIDPEQIVISFSRPGTGTPTITLVGPGKSIDLNRLTLTVNGARDVKLGDAATPPIFKEPDKPQEDDKKLSIAGLSVFLVSPETRQAYAVLKGANFTATTRVFVNGEELQPKEEAGGKPEEKPDGNGRRHRARGARAVKWPPPPAGLRGYKELVSPKIYRLVFDVPPGAGDSLTVTMMDDKGAPVSASADNPLALKITKVSTVSYDAGDWKSPPVLVVRIEGAGFGPSLALGVDGASKESKLLDFSSNEAVVKLVAPEPSVVVTLTNPNSGEAARTVVSPSPPEGQKSP